MSETDYIVNINKDNEVKYLCKYKRLEEYRDKL